MGCVDPSQVAVREVLVSAERPTVVGQILLVRTGKGTSVVVLGRASRVITTIGFGHLADFAPDGRVTNELVNHFAGKFLSIVNSALQNVGVDRADVRHYGAVVERVGSAAQPEDGRNEGAVVNQAQDSLGRNVGRVGSHSNAVSVVAVVPAVRTRVSDVRGAEGQNVSHRGGHDTSEGNEAACRTGHCSDGPESGHGAGDGENHGRLDEPDGVHGASHSAGIVNGHDSPVGSHGHNSQNFRTEPGQSAIALTSHVVDETLLFQIHCADEAAFVRARRPHHFVGQLNAALEVQHGNQ